jgi:hypothetical protein
MSKIKISSNKSFGIVFFVIFLLIFLYPLIIAGNIRYSFLVISLIFLILGLKNSRILTPLNKLWFKFGIFLGKIFTPIIIGITFFFVVTPIGLIMSIFKKDLLNLKFNKDKTYWIEKTGPKTKMKNQF